MREPMNSCFFSNWASALSRVRLRAGDVSAGAGSLLLASSDVEARGRASSGGGGVDSLFIARWAHWRDVSRRCRDGVDRLHGSTAEVGARANVQ